MIRNVTWPETPTYFEGRNGMFTQVGIEIMGRENIDPCNDDPRPGPPGVLLSPHGKRGVARGTISIPVESIDQFVQELLAVKASLEQPVGG